MVHTENLQTRLWPLAKSIALMNNIFCYLSIFLTVMNIIFIVDGCKLCENTSNQIDCQYVCTQYNSIDDNWKLFVYWTTHIIWCFMIGVMVFINHVLRSFTKPDFVIINKWLQVYGTFLVLLFIKVILPGAILLFEGIVWDIVYGLVIFAIIAIEMIIVYKLYNEVMPSGTYGGNMQ